MTNYLRWSLRQFYLLVFLPTQFRREVEDVDSRRPLLRLKERFLYILKLLPWIVLFATAANLISGLTCESFGIAFNWGGSWFGVAFCVAVGVAFGVAVGVAVGVACGVAVGVAGGFAVGVVFGLAVNVAGGLAFWLSYFRLVAYAFDALLSAAAYFAAVRKPETAARAWWWCPVRWNEVIWLPLPFVSKLLALLARQDREYGFRQIAFVAAERRLQRRAAIAALVEVASGDLKTASISEMAEAMDKLNWTTDAPAELPAEFGAVLPRFDRASRHAGQYIVLHSPYRKSEALGQAIAEVEALQRSLIAARGRLAPRLLQTANEWRRLLDAEQKKTQAEAAASKEIPNPFIFGNPVVETDQNLFTGRRDVVRRIEASILGAMQAPTLLLHGPRRMGKTSILNQLPRLLGPDFAPAIVDCQNPAVTSGVATMLRHLSRAMSDGLRLRRVTVEPLTARALEREPFDVFDEWLNSVERTMPGKMRVLLCLDEYERLQSALDAGWGTQVLDALRHLLQHRPRIVLMFTGAHTFQEMGPAWTDRFISARRVRVGFLTRDEVAPLLTMPIPEFDMTYAPGALDALIDAANGQPFLTQATAFELVQLLNEEERKEAGPGDVQVAIARALVSGGEYFANVWSDAGANGQKILLAIVNGETPPDFPEARAWLREHDVLNDAGEFAVPMVRRWVADRHGNRAA